MEKKDTSMAAYSNKPAENWTLQEVLDYVQKVLDFNEKSVQILINENLFGRRLLRVSSVEALRSVGLSLGDASDLWTEIERARKSGLNELEQALKSLTCGDSSEAKKLVRSSVQKKKRQTIIDLLQRSSHEDKSKYLADWFEEVACKNDVVKQLNFDDEERKPEPGSKPDDEEEDFMKTIPLQDRVPAMRKLTNFCDSRFEKYKGTAKQHHAYLTIFGPSGAGKTRLCFEAFKLIEAKAATKKIPYISIYLDFSNGARYNPDIDSKLKGGQFLAARVASRLLADLSYDRFVHYAQTKYSNETIAEIFNQLTLEVVIAAYCNRQHQNRNIAIALVLDEINEVYSAELSDTRLKGFTKQIAIEIGAFMRPSFVIKDKKETFPSQQTILLPIICGTTMDGIDEAIKISGFSRYAPELTLLQKNAIIECFSDYCINNNNTDLENKLPQEIRTEILQYFGVLPRGLEYVLTYLKKCSEVPILVAKIHNAIEEWFDITKYQQSFSESSDAKLFMQMCVIGTSCADKFPKLVQAVINQAKRAGLYYTLSNRLFFCPSILKIFNEHYHFFEEDLLPLPGLPFYWQHFERLEAQLEVIKVDAWLSMGIKQVPLTKLFAGAEYGIGLKNASIQLTPTRYYAESTEFPGSAKYTTENNQINTKETIFDLVIQCREANPLIDIRSAYIASNGKPVLIVKQLKHGKLTPTQETNQNQAAKTKTINYKFISIWLEATQKKLADLGYAEEFKIVYVWITNKKVLNVPNILPADLVLVQKSTVKEYFGPSISLLSNLAKIDDAEKLITPPLSQKAEK